ncbi:GNAT family N-acetyltransferase [Caproiciproducens galactitolivorans]|uniref:GNAT family N-acetyltransferase n=1 Tax=Caproiciproducens galactitolivorans TaxID=642589 RepID=UPI003AF36AA1
MQKINIETNRLILIPLTARQLQLWAEELPSLEKELNCSYDAEPLEGFFLKIIKSQLKITQEDEENYLYHTFWLIVRKEDRIVIGSSDFKSLPNAEGEVEIGYGLGKKYEHNGYMTEAVQAMCQWAEKQEIIRHIIAETERGNRPSQNVLSRCGFRLYKSGDTLWWKR